MGFFSFLFGGPALKLEHPVFGSMRFFRMKDPSRSYWEGWVQLGNPKVRTQALVDAGEEGPGEQSVAFVQDLDRNLDSIRARCQPILVRELREWLRAAKVEATKEEFVLEAIDVPTNGDAQLEWELYFASPLDHDHQFRVPMKGWEPVGEVYIDG
jgi:hypothetical protein